MAVDAKREIVRVAAAVAALLFDYRFAQAGIRIKVIIGGRFPNRINADGKKRLHGAIARVEHLGFDRGV